MINEIEIISAILSTNVFSETNVIRFSYRDFMINGKHPNENKKLEVITENRSAWPTHKFKNQPIVKIEPEIILIAVMAFFFLRGLNYKK
jgi:hypothetical protein